MYFNFIIEYNITEYNLTQICVYISVRFNIPKILVVKYYTNVSFSISRITFNKQMFDTNTCVDINVITHYKQVFTLTLVS